MALISSTGVTYKFRTNSTRAVRTYIHRTVGGNITVNTRPDFPSERGFNHDTVRLPPRAIFTRALCRVNTLTTVAHTRNNMVYRIGPRNVLCGRTTGRTRLTSTVTETMCTYSPTLVLIKLTKDRLVHTNRQCNLMAHRRIFTSHNCRTSNSLIPQDRPNTLVRGRRRTLTRALRVIRRNEIGDVANR